MDLPSREFFEQQRQAADREPYLQGLRIVPIGALLLFQASVEAGWLAVGGAVNLATLALALVLLVAIQAAYWRLHGRPWLAGRRGGVPHEVGAALVAGLAGGGAVAVDLLAPLPISLSGVAIAGMVAAFWLLWGTPLRGHYGIMSVLVLASSFAPALGLAGPAMYAGTAFMYATFGAVLVAGGVLDHVMLLRLRAAARLEG